MQQFKSFIEACDYAYPLAYQLHELEEQYIPFGIHHKYCETSLGDHELYVFPSCKLGKTGIISTPYVEGKINYDAKGISCLSMMPCEINGQTHIIKVSYDNDGGLIEIYSQSFFESYAIKTGKAQNVPVAEFALLYFIANHHRRVLLRGMNKFTFGKEGVAIAHPCSEGLYVAAEFDDSFKIDMDSDQRVALAQAYVDKYNAMHP